MKRLITRILPHAVIVLSLMTLTFFGIDRFNPIMAFMTSELSKWVFALLAVTGFAAAVLLIGMQWSEDDRKAKRALRHHSAADSELPDPLHPEK
ncbi:MAG: hypothetical protein LLF75_02375 [Eubacteriales bacterium]|nr:hypothetical protein [Eubacteriales bacterium]